MTAKPSVGGHELHGDALKASAVRRLRRKETGSGVLMIPAVPSLRAYYQKKLLTDDVSYVGYEREHAPESWPPTDYFEAYCARQDLFDLPAGRAPLEMRWPTYRKN